MQPKIEYFTVPTWSKRSAALIQDRINTILREQSHCSVMLTGGRSAERLYRDWSELVSFQQMNGVSFYFGDERCVSPDDVDSNYRMAMQTLFRQGVPARCSVFRMEADNPDRDAVAMRYGKALPKTIDVMLLGVGEDGHIASLFPGHGALYETVRRVMPVTGCKPPINRLTITPVVIAQAKFIFVVATGLAKAVVLSEALKAPNDFYSFPARLALNATWLLDTPLPENTLQ